MLKQCRQREFKRDELELMFPIEWNIDFRCKASELKNSYGQPP